MSFPIDRPRRLRKNKTIRRLVREHALKADDLVQPLFVVTGENIKKEIASLPGQYHYSVDQVVNETRRIFDLGIPAIILFGIPEHKDGVGSGAYAEDGIVQKAVRAIKKSTPSAGPSSCSG